MFSLQVELTFSPVTFFYCLKFHHSAGVFVEKFRTHEHPSKIVFSTQNFSLTCRFIFFHSPNLADSHAANPLHGVPQIIFLLKWKEDNVLTRYSYEIQTLIHNKGSFTEIIFLNLISGKIVQRGRHFELHCSIFVEIFRVLATAYWNLSLVTTASI
jgi:hypothetical protein